MDNTSVSSPVRQSKRAAKARAFDAYLAGETLPHEERRRLIKEGRVHISLFRAIKLTFAFARGYLENPWSGPTFRRLVRAWLRLGEHLFHAIYRWVRPKDSAPTGTFRELELLLLRDAVIY